MKTCGTLVLLAFASLGSAQVFTDDFNRPDGMLGANYTTVAGTTSISNNAAVGLSGQGMTNVNAGMFSAAYDQMVVSADVSLRDASATLTYQALFLGSNGLTAANNGIMVKLQRQVAGGYSHIGIYTGMASNSTAITTTGGNFQALTNSFSRARLTVMMTSATDLYTGIDTDFDNVDDITFNSTVNLGLMTFGTMTGLHSWGNTGDIDNFSATGPIPEPATMLALGAGAVALLRRRRKA